MKFMMIIKSDKSTEPGKLPDEKLFTAMGKYNEELIKAGVLLSMEGLHPSSQGVRIRYLKGKRTMVEGPFTSNKDTIAGYWLIQVKSRKEAIDWAMKVPMETGESDTDDTREIELRQVFEMEEFPKELLEAPEVKKYMEAEQKFRQQTNQ